VDFGDDDYTIRELMLSTKYCDRKATKRENTHDKGGTPKVNVDCILYLIFY
jgi:hypothetical protein